MMIKQYIDKNSILTEIERRTDELWELLPDASKVENGSITTSEACNTGKYTALESFGRFIGALEMKEVDLDYIKKELDELIRIHKPNGDFGWGTLYNVATHFFELGLKAKGELGMNKNEKEVLSSVCQDIEDADDKIDALERLYMEVKKMLKLK